MPGLLQKLPNGKLLKLASGKLARECCCDVGVNCANGLEAFLALYRIHFRAQGGVYNTAGGLTCCYTYWEAPFGYYGPDNCPFTGHFRYDLVGRCGGQAAKNWAAFCVLCSGGSLVVNRVGMMHEATPGWQVNWAGFFSLSSISLGTWYTITGGTTLLRNAAIPGGTTGIGGDCVPTTIPYFQLRVTPL